MMITPTEQHRVAALKLMDDIRGISSTSAQETYEIMVDLVALMIAKAENSDIAKKLLDTESNAHASTIDQRDVAENTIGNIYFEVFDDVVEWSNLFGYPQAEDAINVAVKGLRSLVEKLTAQLDDAKLPTIEHVQSVFMAEKLHHELQAAVGKHNQVTKMISRFLVAWKGSIPESWMDGFISCGAVTNDPTYPTGFIAPVILNVPRIVETAEKMELPVMDCIDSKYHELAEKIAVNIAHAYWHAKEGQGKVSTVVSSVLSHINLAELLFKSDACKSLLKKIDVLVQERNEAIQSVLFIRCMKHIGVAQQNKNEHGGGECGGCIVEERDDLIKKVDNLTEMSQAAMTIAEDHRHIWDIPTFIHCTMTMAVKELRNDRDMFKKLYEGAIKDKQTPVKA